MLFQNLPGVDIQCLGLEEASQGIQDTGGKGRVLARLTRQRRMVVVVGVTVVVLLVVAVVAVLVCWPEEAPGSGRLDLAPSWLLQATPLNRLALASCSMLQNIERVVFRKKRKPFAAVRKMVTCLPDPSSDAVN